MPDRSAGVIVVGAGAAGAACAAELRAAGYEGSVLLVGRDADPPYDRPSVSKGYLAGSASRKDVLLGHDWDALGVELLTRVSAMRLDPASRVVTLSAGGEVEYADGLVLCTGANVRRLRVDGAQLDGIHYLRALGNADALRADAAPGTSAVLVGGSYVACEVAATLTGLGVRCTLVMLEDAPLSNGFGAAVGAWALELLRSRGVEVVCGDGLERLEGAERVERAVTASGRAVDCDLVVMGTGALPDVMLARAGGLALGRTGGVACSARLEASAPGVWAAGDACELAGRRIEHWEVALGQGRCAARNVLGAGEDFAEVPYFWSDIGDWATLEYVGWGGEADAEVVRGSPGDGDFTVFFGAGGRLIGAVTHGRGADLAEARELLASGGALPAG